MIVLDFEGKFILRQKRGNVSFLGPKSTLMKIYPNLFLRIFWNFTRWQAFKIVYKRHFWILKENFFCFQKSGINGTFGPKINTFEFLFSVFLRLYLMTCIKKVVWIDYFRFWRKVNIMAKVKSVFFGLKTNNWSSVRTGGPLWLDSC